MALTAAISLAGALAVGTGPSAAAAPTSSGARADDPVAAARDTVAETYYEALLRHTRWVEKQWDESAGYYKFANQTFTVVLGNAVLLTRGPYDAATTGIAKQTLLDHTIATIEHYAATNRFNGGTQWGKTLFWEATYESYFTLAAHVLWDDLDQVTRDQIDAITKGQAAYTQSLGTGDDPASGSWTPNGLDGGYYGDTKLEEMGVYAQALAPALAWNSSDPSAPSWEESLGRWMRNAPGLPAADQANPAKIGGVAIDQNTAHNLWDTFLVENHGTYSPHYESELWRTSGRNAIHFIVAGKSVPDVLTNLVNNDEIIHTIFQTMSDSGEPFMPMNNDREHMFGRDVIPLAYLSQVQQNRYAARAETNLASELLAYQAQGARCDDCFVQYNGEAKYEPEARSEIGISYLLHEWRDASDDGPVEAVSNNEFFSRAASVTDYGEGRPGLIAQQSTDAWAGVVDHAGYTKLAWAPQHDDWFTKVGGKTPMFLPSTSTEVDERKSVTYTGLRDGFDATASVMATSEGQYAGMTTLPSGSVVYSTSGTGDDEGKLSFWNMTMPANSVRGLDGTREYTDSDGTTTLPSENEDEPGSVTSTTNDLPTSYVTRKDTVTFPEQEARYVRMQGVRGNEKYYYSVWELEIRGGDDPTNKALDATASASCENVATGETADKAIDGSFHKNTVSNDHDSRWGMPKECRTHQDWLQVDLGASMPVDEVTLYWEAQGEDYLVQVSNDGEHWDTVAERTRDQVSHSRIDDVVFPEQTVQFVRMLGVKRGKADDPGSSYGFSAWEFEARDGAAGQNEALDGTMTASSEDGAGKAAGKANDGKFNTRWAVSTGDRGRDDSWLMLDFGEPRSIDRVLLAWESEGAAGEAYKIQVSDDGDDWFTVANYGTPAEIVSGSSWLDVDERVALVKSGSSGMLSVSHDGNSDHVIMSTGSATKSAGMVLEGYAGVGSEEARALADRVRARSDNANVTVSDADGYLSLFNLSPVDQSGRVTLAQGGEQRRVYLGSQDLTQAGSRVEVGLDAASARVLAPQFSVAGSTVGDVAGLTVNVFSARSLAVTGGRYDTTVTITPSHGGQARVVDIPAGETVRTIFPDIRPYPLADLAVGSVAFPNTQLPAGMSSPGLALDDDPRTAWDPGEGSRRMVVDLGSVQHLTRVRSVWGPHGGVPGASYAVSVDGQTFDDVATSSNDRIATVPLDDVTARYLAITVDGPSDGSLAGLTTLSVYGPTAATSQIVDELQTAGDDAVSALDVEAVPGSVQAGEKVVVHAYALDPYGVRGGELPQGSFEVTSSQESDRFSSDGSFVPTAAGSRLLTVTAGERTAQTVVSVDAAAASHLQVVPERGFALPGEPLDFTVAVVDRYGNPLATLDHATVDIEGLEDGEELIPAGLVLTRPGTRELTVRAGDLTGDLELVVPGAESAGPQISAELVGGDHVVYGASGVRVRVAVTHGDTAVTGLVDVRSGHQVYDTAVLLDGQATLQLPRKLAVGTHRLAVHYAPVPGSGEVESSAEVAPRPTLTVTKAELQKFKVKGKKKTKKLHKSWVKVKVSKKLTNDRVAKGKVKIKVKKHGSFTNYKKRSMKKFRTAGGKLKIKIAKRFATGKKIRVKAVYKPKKAQKAGVKKTKGKVKTTVKK